MGAENYSSVTEFILVGFPELHQMKMTFFSVVLLLYVVSISGNCVIIMVVIMEPKLHMPMYFFLTNFSLAELCSSSVVIPKLLTNILQDQNTICFTCCMIQNFMVFFMGATQSINLIVMSFDRYLAIHKPFEYNTKMTNELSLYLSLFAWVGGFTMVFCQSIVIWIANPFCGRNVIDHFFCDVGPLLKLACTDMTIMELIGLFYGTIILWGSLLIIVITFACIIHTIVHIPSETGRSKAFSTCSSHLTIVCIFYGAMIFIYLKPSSQSDTHINKIVFLGTSSVLPALSPFIFTIRNKDFKTAVNKILIRSCEGPLSAAMKTRQRCLQKWRVCRF